MQSRYNWYTWDYSSSLVPGLWYYSVLRTSQNHLYSLEQPSKSGHVTHNQTGEGWSVYPTHLNLNLESELVFHRSGKILKPNMKTVGSILSLLMILLDKSIPKPLLICLLLQGYTRIGHVIRTPAIAAPTAMALLCHSPNPDDSNTWSSEQLNFFFLNNLIFKHWIVTKLID